MNTWLHIGLGNFHRAHQACYLNQYINKIDNNWQIIAGNIRNDSEQTVKAINQQDGKYTLMTVSSNGEKHFETISSIKKCIEWSDDLAELILNASFENTYIISFTVTEAGYYLDENLHIDVNNKDIQSDLNGFSRTIYGVIYKILKQRQANNAPKVTLLCCDNVRENGEKFLKALLEFIDLRGDTDFKKYVLDNTTSPNTMVDRITPKPSDDLKDIVKQETGIEDLAPIMSEQFIQWVIEDKFANIRPELDKVGVLFVDSVLPYEDAKLRILNASHSALSFKGALKKLNYVYECANDEDILQAAYDYITNDVIPCIDNGIIDLNNYRDIVLDRFKNPYIKDSLERITQDSISKINTFLLPTLKDCYRLKRDCKKTLQIVANYFYFLNYYQQGKLHFNYKDSLFDSNFFAELLNSTNAKECFAKYKPLFADLCDNQAFVNDLITVIDSSQI